MIRGRSPVVRSAIRAASPLALLVAAFLFFAGHNQPGGGFSAGLVIGAVVALRTVAGIGRPQDATRWFAVGTALVSVVALAPLLGKVKSGSALVFDAGVTAIVVGLFVAVFDGLDADELGRDEVQV